MPTNLEWKGAKVLLEWKIRVFSPLGLVREVDDRCVWCFHGYAFRSRVMRMSNFRFFFGCLKLPFCPLYDLFLLQDSTLAKQ